MTVWQKSETEKKGMIWFSHCSFSYSCLCFSCSDTVSPLKHACILVSGFLNQVSRKSKWFLQGTEVEFKIHYDFKSTWVDCNRAEGGGDLRSYWLTAESTVSAPQQWPNTCRISSYNPQNYVDVMQLLRASHSNTAGGKTEADSQLWTLCVCHRFLHHQVKVADTDGRKECDFTQKKNWTKSDLMFYSSIYRSQSIRRWHEI